MKNIIAGFIVIMLLSSVKAQKINSTKTNTYFPPTGSWEKNHRLN